ncbi:Pimeloyl-ACP methyl ester carboxylesterase [Actinacidiphila rubida]|uniref:Pimeloyl-ACP methyl ester carboxylesterase n=2 Tax=Actinacidiphila rubida TaxID=310780 RepID=A0A1H8QN88_9ACTN|nr:Pimeloyl-ACP methyl ester carboxylesterase [Actinacidiphila rubida]
MDHKPTIVLVHGAWADGSSWDGVITRLEHMGYSVVAPPDPLRGVSSDAAYLADYLSTLKGPLVLVGHSYGGMVITNAALGNRNVKALVYDDAYIPAQGQTVVEITGAKPGSALAVSDPTTVFNLVPYPGAPAGDADLYLKPKLVRTAFAQDVPFLKQNQLIATQRPVTASALNEPSGAPAWKTIPSWALIGRQDRIIPAAEQRAMARTAHAHVTEINSSHVSLISHPQAVADVIVSAARHSLKRR